METDLYKKYKVGKVKEMPELNPLSFILRKAEIGENVTDLEMDWLKQNKLFDTIAVIKEKQLYEAQIRKQLNNEILTLKVQERKFHNIHINPTLDSANAFLLYKISSRERLSRDELKYDYGTYNRLLKFLKMLKKLGFQEGSIPFYKVTEGILAKILKKEYLDSSEVDYLYSNGFFLLTSFLSYQLTPLTEKYEIKSSFDSKKSLYILYILQKVDNGQWLSEKEVNFLKESKLDCLLELQDLASFNHLKKKYKATSSDEVSLKCNLYKVLKKLDASLPLTESDINFLKKRKLIETLKFNYKKETDQLRSKIARNEKLNRKDVKWCEEYNFSEIVSKWLIKMFDVKPDNCTINSELFPILKKLAFNERLADSDVVYLEGENLMKRSNKIFIAHHRLEALFYEDKFKKTKDHWCLVNSSASWRKAILPKNALKQTDGLKFKQIKPARLRAALLTTRGGTLRDLEKLSLAEECALEAIKHFPDSHNPYTLMGALCYQTGRHGEGDSWFAKAEALGASSNSLDSEIKKILRKNRDQKLIDHLLKKDPVRFKWVKEMFSQKKRSKSKPKAFKSN